MKAFLFSSLASASEGLLALLPIGFEDEDEDEDEDDFISPLVSQP